MLKFLIYINLILLVFASCKSPEARRPISKKSGTFIDKSVERSKKLNAKEHQKIKTIIQNNSENTYITSQNGFWYYYNTKKDVDSLQTPNFGDLVTFDYNVKTLSGNIIYTKEELKTQNYVMDQEELFAGLREGLKLMKTGETVTFLFPSQKAFGYYGDNNKIGISVPLMCEVTIHSITQK